MKKINSSSQNLVDKYSEQNNSSKALLSWIAKNFKPIKKIEDASYGYTYCEIINKCHPDSLNMNKVSYSHKLDNHNENNYKLLQMALDKNNIKKYIDVKRLMKGKFLDNLEALQWFKVYFNNMNPSSIPEDFNLESKENDSKSSSIPIRRPFSQKLKSNNQFSKNKNINCSPLKSIKPVSKAKEKFKSNICEVKQHKNIEEENELINLKSENSDLKNLITSIIKEKELLQTELNQLKNETQKLKLNNTNLNKVVNLVGREKDFYFSKLRDIEILLSKGKLNNILVEKILFSKYELIVLLNQNSDKEVLLELNKSKQREDKCEQASSSKSYEKFFTNTNTNTLEDMILDRSKVTANKKLVEIDGSYKLGDVELRVIK